MTEKKYIKETLLNQIFMSILHFNFCNSTNLIVNKNIILISCICFLLKMKKKHVLLNNLSKSKHKRDMRKLENIGLYIFQKKQHLNKFVFPD